MISQHEYLDRRTKLMGQLPADAVVVIACAPVVMRTESAEYPYRQANNFTYLCGFPEPHATLVLTQNDSILFCQEKNPEKEIWTGRIIGLNQAKQDYGFSEVYPYQDLESKLSQIRQGKTDCSKEAEKLLAELRLIKSESEIKLMAQAASISAIAHKKAMGHVRPGMMEYELAAFYEYEFKIHGANGLAYESIVGAGKNANILHYRENSDKMKSGELVLVDAACEYHQYAADITRTYPVEGSFTPAQRELYLIVLQAQMRAIELVKPGVTLDDLNKQIASDMTQGLIDVGLLKGEHEALVESKAYRRFYMHGCSHWLGLDVHDVGAYKLNDVARKLEKNMVITVEPGLYIPAADDIDPRWHHIGIRIEDDVQVTDLGSEVLSHEAPKSLEEIAAVCVGSQRETRLSK